MSIAPRMSIVLATDSYATIRPVIRCLSKQTLKQKLEVVLVTPDAKSMHSNLAGEIPSSIEFMPLPDLPEEHN